MVLTLFSNCCSIWFNSWMEHDPKPSPKSFLRDIWNYKCSNMLFIVRDIYSLCLVIYLKKCVNMHRNLKELSIQPFWKFKKLNFLHHAGCFLLQMLSCTRFIFRHQRDRDLRCKEIVHKWLKEKTNDVIQISATKLYVYVNCSCII